MRVSVGLDRAIAKTHPDHARCNVHKNYRLNCAQYEDLIARSGQRCEICGMPGSEMPQGKLFIDHDITPWGVRGLLCLRCNSVLGITKDLWPDGQAYLANSWWRAQCTALGIPAGLGEEPALGSAIRNQMGTIWIRCPGQWEAPSQDGHHPPSKTWRELYWSYGAHNLVPYDLRAAYEDGSLHYSVRRWLGEREELRQVRALFGIPEPEPKKPRGWVREYRPRDGLPWLATPEKTAEALRALVTPEECRRIAELLMQEESDTGQPVAATPVD